VGGSLPVGWTQLTNPQGQLSYFNTSTGVTQSEHPGAQAQPQPKAQQTTVTLPVEDQSCNARPDLPPAQTLPSGWKELKNPDGKIFFTNFSTGETSWSRPV